MGRMLLVLFMLTATGSAAYACSEDELQAKAITLADLVKTIVAAKPDQAVSWRQKQVEVDRLAERSTDIDQICAAYDKAIAEAQASR